MVFSSSSISELIGFIGLTEARIGQLFKDGVIIKTARGEYDLKQSVLNYCEYLRGVSRKSEDVTEEKYQRTRLMTAKADIAELEADEMANILVRRDAVEHVNKRVASTLNTNLLGIADRVSSRVAASSSGDECHHLINSEVRHSLDSCLIALGNIEVDESLIDVTREGAAELLLKHEVSHEDFDDEKNGGIS